MVVLDGLMSSFIVSTSSVDNKNSSRWAGCASRPVRRLAINFRKESIKSSAVCFRFSKFSQKSDVM